MNFAETSTIGKMLAEQGIRKVRPGEKADICVINTCSVTELADKKCRQAIRRLAHQHPGAFVVVTGCYAQLKPEEVVHIEGVNLVLGAEQKLDLPSLLERELREGHDKTVVASPSKDIRAFAPSCSADDRTRHFLKVQDGCDYFCSYCTIPFARGRSRNGSIESLVAQARQVAAEGGKEIVLTGVNIGDFGKSTDERFIDLIRALDEVEETGYGIVMPDLYDLTLEEPQMVKQAGSYGVKLRASAPSIHMIKADITAEVSPIVGTEQQSEELIGFLLREFETDPRKIWDTNMFGKSLYELMNEGLHNKLAHMPDDALAKLSETLQRIIYEGSGGLICIIL